MTATLTTPKRIRIVGAQARELTQHVRVFVSRHMHRRSWTEVQGMRECSHGCKLYVRNLGAMHQYRLIHSASYGCALGRDDATREVPVSVCPSATD